MTHTATPGSAMDDDALLLRIPEVARALNISTGLTWQLVRAGALESVRIGQRCRRVPRAALERAIRDGIPARASSPLMRIRRGLLVISTCRASSLSFFIFSIALLRLSGLASNDDTSRSASSSAC